jgi:hypothetical protein
MNIESTDLILVGLDSKRHWTNVIRCVNNVSHNNGYSIYDCSDGYSYYSEHIKCVRSYKEKLFIEQRNILARNIVVMLAKEYRKVVIEYHTTSFKNLKICYKRVRLYDNEYQLYIKAKSLLLGKL